VTFGEESMQRMEAITFDVVNIWYPYNAIFGCNTIIKFAAMIHQSYLCMKLPTAGGIVIVFGNQEEARRCEGNTSYAMKNVRAIEAAESKEDTKSKPSQSDQAHRPEGVTPAEHTEKVSLSQIKQSSSTRAWRRQKKPG